MTPLAFRPWDEGDRKFVVETFLDSYRTAHAAGLISMADWKAVMGDQFGKILARPGVAVIVAHQPGESGRADLYGWIAAERGHDKPYVIYVYVKQSYRRWGIGRRLFAAAAIDPASGFDYACKTGIVTTLRAVKPHLMRLARFNPLIVRFPPPTLHSEAINP